MVLTDVFLTNYTISEDGSTMTINIGIAGSMGYTRACKVKLVDDNEYITFYSTFGLLNSRIGAKNKFDIQLNPSCEKIYFNRGKGGYTLVLLKNNQTYEWEKGRE